MKNLLNDLTQLTVKNEPFAMATVITRSGSAPRSAGARMIVRTDGSTAGTVGGGILEAKVEKLANKVLETRDSVVEHFQFSGKDASTMDAICGGQVDVLVEWIDAADPTWKSVLDSISYSITHHKKAWLLTQLPVSASLDNPSGPADVQAHAVVRRDGTVSGVIPSGISVDTIYEMLQPELVILAGRSWMIEPIESGGVVYIFGAGHVGQSLAFFTRAVGFYTVVLDDRPEYANVHRFPTADEVIVLDTFDNVMAGLTIDKDSFIVITTRGHLNDREVLGQALRTPAGYIGMIGSKRKTLLVYEELRKTGFGDQDFQRVHAPIGLPIQAETPEEIGVSITAEMIQARAQLTES